MAPPFVPAAPAAAPISVEEAGFSAPLLVDPLLLASLALTTPTGALWFDTTEPPLRAAASKAITSDAINTALESVLRGIELVFTPRHGILSAGSVISVSSPPSINALRLLTSLKISMQGCGGGPHRCLCGG